MQTELQLSQHLKQRHASTSAQQALSLPAPQHSQHSQSLQENWRETMLAGTVAQEQQLLQLHRWQQQLGSLLHWLHAKVLQRARWL
jgi:hypothetical protein